MGVVNASTVPRFFLSCTRVRQPLVCSQKSHNLEANLANPAGNHGPNATRAFGLHRQLFYDDELLHELHLDRNVLNEMGEAVFGHEDQLQNMAQQLAS